MSVPSSRMLSALIPLNDLPFFTFSLKDGVEPEVEVGNLLNTLSMQQKVLLMLYHDRYKLYSHKGWQQNSEKMLKIKVKFN